MNETISEELTRRGLDVDFLLWLEGPDERLPRVDRICEISGSKFADAVRAAVWLETQVAHPELIQPNEPSVWQQRYREVQEMLWNALRQSMICRRLERPSDLADLEEVLGVLLPPNVAAVYRHDIQRLRKAGHPIRLQDFVQTGQSRKSGGRRQSEQVERMKAAYAHVSEQSEAPYRDLCLLWNEGKSESNYDAETMRQLLRKGDKPSPELVAFWREIYLGNRWVAFPGNYPAAATR